MQLTDEFFQKIRIWLLRSFALLNSVFALIAVRKLFLIPSDAKNDWLLGMSRARLVEIAGLASIALVLAGLVIITFVNARLTRLIIARLTNVFDNLKSNFAVFFLSLLGLISALLYYMYVDTSKFKDFNDALLVRLTPVILFLILFSALVLIFQQAWGGGLFSFSRALHEIEPASFEMRRSGKELRLFLALILIISTITFIAVIMNLRDFRSLFLEAGLIESITFITFMAAGITAVFLLIINSRAISGFFVLLPAVAFLSAMEEVSWFGLFEGEQAILFYTSRIDGIHDFLAAIVNFLFFREQNMALLALLSFTLVAWFLYLLFLFARFTFKHPGWLRHNRPLAYLIIGVLFIVNAVIVDSGIFQRIDVLYVEELSELFASVALLFSAFVLRSHTNETSAVVAAD